LCGRFRDVAKDAEESGRGITSDNRAYYSTSLEGRKKTTENLSQDIWSTDIDSNWVPSE